MSSFNLFNKVAKAAKGFSFAKAGTKVAGAAKSLSGLSDLEALRTGNLSTTDKLIALGGAGFGAQMAGSAGLGLADAARDTFSNRTFEAQEKIEELSRSRLMGVRMEAERRAREIAVNSQILASINPRLYAQLQAGRRLPRGAVVIGGRPRTDLLEQVAASMAGGAYDPPPSAEEQFLQELAR